MGRVNQDPADAEHGLQPDDLAAPDATDPAMPDMPRDGERTRGRYVRYRDGEPAGLEERFALGEISPGVVRVRSVVVLRAPVGRLECDVRYEVGLVRLQVRWTGTGAGAVRDATADYTCADGVVSGRRVVDGVKHPRRSLAGTLDPGCLLTQGLLVTRGRAGVDLVVPDTSDPTDPGSFLSPLTLRAIATLIGERDVDVDGVARHGLEHRWEAEGVGPVVVVDRGGVLLHQRIESPDAVHEARLVDVTGPWPRPLDWPV